VGPVIFSASDRAFGLDHQRTLKLNTTDVWIIRTDSEALYYAHPFHIHVNPFQTWREGPDGNYQTVWRDTILVKIGEPVYLYTHYKDFTGKFVYHCHILDHEDQGMMELVEIVP
jgi:FtsP/CotA-like multicopper oxidase with cupredoxin domain